jgi:hypothetical protein
MGRTPPESLDGLSFVRRLHGVSGGAGLRKHAVARALRARPAEEVARLLAEVLDLDRSGNEAASCVLGTMMAVLEDERLGRELTRGLAQLPPGALQQEVVGLLAAGPAWRNFDEDAAARADARNFPETLGMLKTKARTARDPDALARIALASNPSVVRNLLVNPRLTEASVVRLAARRPARSEPLVEVWRSRWGTRHSVRRALVFNPYLPPEVGVKVVPLLLRTDWEEIAGDGALHPSVRAEAKLLLAAEGRGSARRAAPRVVVLDAER